MDEDPNIVDALNKLEETLEFVVGRLSHRSAVGGAGQMSLEWLRGSLQDGLSLLKEARAGQTSKPPTDPDLRIRQRDHVARLLELRRGLKREQEFASAPGYRALLNDVLDDMGASKSLRDAVLSQV